VTTFDAGLGATFVLMLLSNAARLALLVKHFTEIWPEIADTPQGAWRPDLSSCRARTYWVSIGEDRGLAPPPD